MASSPRRFVAVEVVCREWPAVHALEHVLAHIHACLDVTPILSVAIAAESGSLYLLALAAAREKRKLISWSSELVRAYRQHQFAAAMNVAAGRGFFNVIRWLRFVYLPKGKFHGAERAALWHGRLDVLQFLHDQFQNKVEEDVTDSEDAIAHAAAQGRLDLVQWFCEHKGAYACGWSTMDAALANKHMEVVLYLDLHLGNRCTRRGLEQAALNGHLEVVVWLNENRYEIRTFRTLQNAIRNGHMAIVQYIIGNVAVAGSWMQDGATSAIQSGQLDILIWLTENSLRRYELHTKHLFVVAQAGYLHVLQWLHEQGYDLHCNNAFTVKGAIVGGHLDMLKWMYDMYDDFRCAIRSYALDGAASHGHLHIVQWLHDKQYTFSRYAMDGAAANGHLHVVQWLHEHGSEGCTTQAMDSAAANGHLEIVQFLHKHRKEGCTTAAMDVAAKHGHLEIVRFLQEERGEGCTFRAAAESYHLPVLEFLHMNRRLRGRFPSSTKAAALGDLPLLRWLYRHDKTNFSFDATIQQARANHHYQILRWLETLAESGKSVKR